MSPPPVDSIAEPNSSVTAAAGKRPWQAIEVTGLFLLLLSFATLMVAPQSLANLFNIIVDKTFPIVINVFLISNVGIAIIVSVIFGRVLERLGFTDALIRTFLPVMNLMRINSSVLIPSIYNILGDINAAGKIGGAIMKKARATRAEQMIAVATMVQSQQSFATFMLGIVALSAIGINVFPVVLLTIFLPLVLVPFLLSHTLYRDTRAVSLQELPRFTPTTPFTRMLFDSGKEGVELLLLLVIPAVAVVFTVIGVLEFMGIWPWMESGMAAVLGWLSIDVQTGILSLVASPTLAMAELAKLASSVDPRLAVGSFVLASSGLPISVIFGQIPATWAEVSDLSEREAMGAAMLGILMRVGYAFLVGYIVTPWVIAS